MKMSQVHELPGLFFHSAKTKRRCSSEDKPSRHSDDDDDGGDEDGGRTSSILAEQGLGRVVSQFSERGTTSLSGETQFCQQ